MFRNDIKISIFKIISTFFTNRNYYSLIFTIIINIRLLYFSKWWWCWWTSRSTKIESSWWEITLDLDVVINASQKHRFSRPVLFVGSKWTPILAVQLLGVVPRTKATKSRSPTVKAPGLISISPTSSPVLRSPDPKLHFFDKYIWGAKYWDTVVMTQSDFFIVMKTVPCSTYLV